MKTEKILFNLGSGIDNVIQRAQQYEVSLYNYFIQPTGLPNLPHKYMKELKAFLSMSTGIDTDEYKDWFQNPDEMLKVIMETDTGKQGWYRLDSGSAQAFKGYFRVPNSAIVAYENITQSGKSAQNYGRIEEAIQGLWADSVIEKAVSSGKAGHGTIHLSDAQVLNTQATRLYDIEIKFPDISLYTEVKYDLSRFHLGEVEKELTNFRDNLYAPLREYLAQQSIDTLIKQTHVREQLSPTRNDIIEYYVDIDLDTEKMIPDTLYRTLGEKFTDIKFTNVPIYKSHNQIKLASEILTDLKEKGKASLILEWDMNDSRYVGNTYASFDGEKHELEREAQRICEEIIRDKVPLELKKLEMWYGKP